MAAVRKTTVPDTFLILLSQRRWINSTIHNLAELILVSDLCGMFCFSMQFVVDMELAGTLVPPAAISFLIIASHQHYERAWYPAHRHHEPQDRVCGGWMLVYLLSLPIWNGILPAYPFWHFDFSWGQTRARSEGTRRIIMRRWAEFERERRWNSREIQMARTTTALREFNEGC